LRTVLLTAFEPFGGETVNASWEAAKLVDRWRCGEAVVASQMLACAYEICVSEFAEAVERLKPGVVLMTGQAARRGMVSVERFARKGASVARPDNLGVAPGAAGEGPDVLEATVPTGLVARAIRDAGVAARVSTDAGDYVCNHLYYGALRRLAALSPAPAAVFIHLPAAPGQSPPRASVHRLASTDAARALQAGIRALLRL
jgi:pyroglutamyl-peptidase